MIHQDYFNFFKCSTIYNVIKYYIIDRKVDSIMRLNNSCKCKLVNSE